MNTWLEGPPIEPGLYWYQVQGSGMIRSEEVVKLEHSIGGVPIGSLVLKNAAPDSWTPVLVDRPFRRWMKAGGARPSPDLTWLDPRYTKQIEGVEK